jgi:DNA ligase (NAD+)
MAKIIVDAGFNTLSKMLKARISEIATIPGVGQTKADAFVNGFQKRIGLISKLLANGVQIQIVSGVLVGKSFCMTGFRDNNLSDAIEKVGGTIKSGVSKDLNYLICLDPSSSSGKAQKARQYGTKIISIDDAWALTGLPKP